MMQEPEQTAAQLAEDTPGGGITGLLLLLAQSTVLCTLLQAILLGGDAAGSAILPVMLIPYGMLLYVADLLFLRKERTVASLVILNGCFAAALLAGAIWQFGLSSLVQAALLTASCVMAAVQAPRLVQKQPTLSSMILWTDFTAAAMVLMAADLSLTSGSPVWCVIPGAGFLFSLTGLIAIRLADSGNHSALIPAGLMAGTVLLTLLLMVTAATPAGRGLVAAWSGIRRGGGILWNAIERFMEMIAALFPKEQFEETASMAETGLPDTSGVTDNSGAAFGHLLLVLLVIAVVAAALAALWVFARSRLAGRRVHVERRAVRRKKKSPKLRDAIRQALEGMRRRSEARAWVRRNRKNAAGLYFSLVEVCRKTPLEKRPGESPAQFLGRLGQVLSADRTAEKAGKHAERGQYEQLQDIDFPALIRETDRVLFMPDAAAEELPYAEALLQAVKHCAGDRRKQQKEKDKASVAPAQTEAP